MINSNGPFPRAILAFLEKPLTLTGDEAVRSAHSGRFEALLDKLVAVHMDLEPVCDSGKKRSPIVASLEAIANACHVLRFAIADVRDVIHDIEGLTDLPEGVLHSSAARSLHHRPLSNRAKLLLGKIDRPHRRR
jgi:hypothetical protein